MKALCTVSSIFSGYHASTAMADKHNLTRAHATAPRVCILVPFILNVLRQKLNKSQSNLMESKKLNFQNVHNGKYHENSYLYAGYCHTLWLNSNKVATQVCTCVYTCKHMILSLCSSISVMPAVSASSSIVNRFKSCSSLRICRSNCNKYVTNRNHVLHFIVQCTRVSFELTRHAFSRCTLQLWVEH